MFMAELPQLHCSQIKDNQSLILIFAVLTEAVIDETAVCGYPKLYEMVACKK